ncbi:EF-hand domain-containing protein [Parasphingorhabdus sp.]|uniref:EF-hand domain-containing protein n=1 Tax=Parasphingorhabdus sp. TaxID=2709688 RepID=UPI003A8CAD42
MSNNSSNLMNICLAITLGLALTSPVLAQRGGRASPTLRPPATGMPAGDNSRDRTRDRLDTPDQDRLRGRDRLDSADRDRIRDRDTLYLGTRDRLRTFDRDRDGSINRSEFHQWHDSSFEALDSDGDGGFSLQEFQAVGLGPGPMGSASLQRQRSEERAQLRKAERFRVMDGNDDGTVSRTEYMKFGELNYLDADTNDDGKLSYGELQQFHRGW